MNKSNKSQHFHAELPYKGIYQNVKNTSFMHTSEIWCCVCKFVGFIYMLRVPGGGGVNQERNNQSLKGAVVVTHCQNEAKLNMKA